MTRVELLVAGVILAAALAAFHLRVSRNMRDFEVGWTAARRAAVAAPLYRTEDEHYQFKYLPAFAVLAIPMGRVPLPAAKQVWFLSSVALLVALLALSVRLLPEQRKSTALLAMSAVVIQAKFYAHELDLGQMNLAFAVAATGALAAMKTKRELLAAALIVLATAIKPYGVFLLPLVLVRGQAAPAVATALGVALLVLLPMPLYGFTGTIGLHRDWLHTLVETTGPNLLNPDNVSLVSMYAKWFGARPLSSTLAALSALALVGCVVVVFLRRRSVSFPDGLEGSLLLLMIPLVSPQGWDYVLLVATPAVVYLANYLDTLPKLWRGLTVIAGLTIGLSLFDLMGREAYAAFMGSAVISICALTLVATLTSLRLRATT